MGTIKEGINGPFRGKAGSVIGSSWRKINYIKGLPRFKKKRVPSTGQALQREKFALLNHFLYPLSGILETGFKQFTGAATGRNAAFRYNYDHAFLVEDGEVKLDYPALQLSHGSLFTAGDEKAEVDGDILYVSWNPDTYGMGGMMDDTACIVVYDETLEVLLRNDMTAIRHDGGDQVRIIKDTDAHSSDLHVWLFFADKLGRHVSKTVYIPVEHKLNP
ncbi:DUF6266 family protein [Parapedobacter tibetensis]|uniref:DUF6266 family protein n=1 Tax=Parapedobacter tibetensis TaxID=2972951 RepID=UPI00214D7167|nr:DUF6266 family protein [Parapedobacter tibetensis]